jgi:methyl-accepting chemotaxis protein WspA
MERWLQAIPLHFLHKLSYRFKIFLVTILLLIALITSAVASFICYNHWIKHTEEHLKVYQQQKELRELVSKVFQHQLLLKRYLHGDSAIKGEIIKLQTSVTANLDTLVGQQQSSNTEHTKPPLKENIFDKEELFQQLQEQWQIISRRTFELDDKDSDAAHEQMTRRLEELMLYLEISIETAYGNFPGTPALLYATLVSLPQGETLLMSILDESNQRSFQDEPRTTGSLDTLFSQLKNSLNKTAFDVRKGIKNPEKEDSDVSNLLNQYVEATDSFIKYNTYSGWDLLSFLSRSEDVLKANFALRDGIALQIRGLWQESVDALYFDRWRTLLVTLVCSLLAFTIAAYIILELYVPAKNMSTAVDKFSKGDLSSRVKIYFDDELGRFGTVINGIGETFEGLIKQLHRTGIQLITSTTEIAAAAKQQEATVIEQEATTKEIAVTASEISSTAREFANSMNSISQTAEQASDLASSGKEGLSQMEAMMRQLVEASGTIASRLGVLNEKASGITNVVTTIAKVADQTNLLSLNASIEAEKAGEMGRSFGVIAREIRRLADQTANATLDIEKMVNEMASAVSSAVMGVDKFSEEIRIAVSQVTRVSGVLSQIIEQVQGLTLSFENVNKGMQNQTVGAQQINEAINQLSDVAQQTSESIRQFQNAIEQLTMAARDMQSSAARIKHEALPQVGRV